jgi:hypothetical protein
MPRTPRAPLRALTILLLGGTALAAAPAHAQGQRPEPNPARDWVETRDFMDPYGRYLQRLREHDRVVGGPIGERLPGSRMTDQQDREGFERGYRAGREAERRQRAMQEAGQEAGGNSRSASSGSGGDTDWYLVVPDILPDTRRYRGMQDFALIPDRTPPMERLFGAAQGLREAIQATAQLPPGDRRDRAIDLLHEALLKTQQAMALIPPEQRTR